MKYNISIGGVIFHILSPYKMQVEDTVIPFMISECHEWDVEIIISTDYHLAPTPIVPMTGDDLLIEYYIQDNEVLCLSKGGIGKYLSITVCNKIFSKMTCYMNVGESSSLYSIGNFLRLIPMRTILLHYGVLFFHASQIATKNKGILFTAPSGTGKTTQAKLWKKYRDAKMICNDRTLVRSGLTYGYPVDGSEPVISSDVYSLGAVVLLSQGPINVIHRLKPSVAIANIMPQLVMDGWNPKARQMATETILDMMIQVPIYAFSCTPDESAVLCLEKQLMQDGILERDEDLV